jgi:hypothetical protein
MEAAGRFNVRQWPARDMRTLAVVVLEALALVVLFIVVATVVIPRAAPPPNRPTPTIPSEALRDCPGQVPGCR